MSFKRLFIASAIIGVLAGLVMLLTDLFQNMGFITSAASLTFVTFIAWSCYFFSGSTPKNAFISWLSFIIGILCAVVIFVLNTLLTQTGMNVPYVSLPIATFIGVILMCLAERLPFGNRVPAVYLGAATFFGMMGNSAISVKGYLVAGIGELAYAVLGLVSGYLTVQISNFVSDWHAKSVSDIQFKVPVTK